jgi:gas vesicle protein
MARDEASGSGTVLLAFLMGAVAGAAVALLYAPTTGRETRERLGEKSREASERAASLAEKGRQVITDSRETLSTAMERGREAYEQSRSREKA